MSNAAAMCDFALDESVRAKLARHGACDLATVSTDRQGAHGHLRERHDRGLLHSQF